MNANEFLTRLAAGELFADPAAVRSASVLIDTVNGPNPRHVILQSMRPSTKAWVTHQIGVTLANLHPLLMAGLRMYPKRCWRAATPNLQVYGRVLYIPDGWAAPKQAEQPDELDELIKLESEGS